MIQKIDNATVREAVQQAYERCKNETGGKNADYIPYLANVPSTLFGIAACLPDGEVIAVGDTDYKFGIESVSKVPTAILTMNQYSAQEVLTKIGADATGLPFNSIMAILLENAHPSTPLVNAGAISACSMVQPVGDSDGKWKAITGFIEGLAGSQVEVIDELYKSETATNFNNKSIAWLLKNYNRIYDDPDMALDIYTRQCSIGVTAKQLATMAATIANGGKNPVTKQQVFKPELSPKIASMMATVGFYEHTGDWLFTTGLPAKTGVGGGIMGVVPGVMGVAAFAPPLDEAGNSVKAQKALAYIAGHLNLNIFGTTRCVMAEKEAAQAETCDGNWAKGLRTSCAGLFHCGMHREAKTGRGRKKTGTAGRTIVTLFRGEEFIARTVPGGGIRPAACEKKARAQVQTPPLVSRTVSGSCPYAQAVPARGRDIARVSDKFTPEEPVI